MNGSGWKIMLGWGVVLTAVLSIGAFAVEKYSGTCMFVAMPYFVSLAALMPAVKLKRFGSTIGAYIPYTVLGFFPLFYFDWLVSRSLVGLWAVFVFALSGFLIGACADLVYGFPFRMSGRTRAVAAGMAVQAATFFTMLLGLKYLYLNSADAASHLHFFDQNWFFTLPWMVVNGGFGGYTAFAIRNRSPAARRPSPEGI
jgi:hypothetical protein